MNIVVLGQTDIKVSQLCFGSLTLGPLQQNLPLNTGVSVLNAAIEAGINFIDTAETYGTYQYIRKALEVKSDLVISTKSYAYTKKMAGESLTAALKSINRDYIDIFMLHEQESVYTLQGHWEALEYYLKQKKLGYIRAIGISTHRIAGVRAGIKYDEIDVIHPIINLYGIGIEDGPLEEMESAIKDAHNAGKGIIAMKPLGGGHLIPDTNRAFNYILSLPFIDSIAVGMQNKYEVSYNAKFFSGEAIESEIVSHLSKIKRKLFIHDWCEGCGKCIDACSHGALYMIKNKTYVIEEKCILCGYCARSCPNFCIKVI